MTAIYADSGRFQLFDQKPAAPHMAAEVVGGLKKPQKAIPPKYFYDSVGSQLFDEITRLPEYYLTRAEVAILKANRAAIAAHVGSGRCMLEYGSGSSVKVRVLLEACRPAAYVPVDISKEHLTTSARAVYQDHPWLAVFPVCADYTGPFELPPPVAALPRLCFFPGSSIGNFEPPAAEAFLRNTADILDTGACLIVGVDTKKDTRTLLRAYNDAAGVTARFNRNALLHVNTVLGANFDPNGFAHRATYNAEAGRIEMYLDARQDQVVRVNGETIEIRRGEALHTENSYKYAPEEFVAKAERAGFDCVSLWQDPQHHFMVLLLRAR